MNLFKTGFAWILILAGTLFSLQAFAVPEAKEIHLSFQERVLSAYALQAYQASPEEQTRIYARVLQYINTVTNAPVTEINVKNFSEFLKHFRGEWPSSGNLQTDLQRIESLPTQGLARYRSASPRVQMQIDNYLKAHVNHFKGFSMTRLQDLSELKPEAIKQYLKESAKKQLAEFDTIGSRIASTAFTAIPDPQDRIRFRILFDQYYALQSLDTKKYIISEMLGKKIGLNDQEKFEVMVQNSGPQFQKLLQVIIRQNGVPDHIKASFKALEDSAKQVPWWQVEQLLKTEKENFEFTYFERKPLGIGTMAQVHRAKMIINGKRQDVVVRFLKPNISQRVDEDHAILVKVTQQIDNDPEYRSLNGAMMTPLMNDITDTVREELNMKATMDRQTLARTAYDKEVLLKTPEYKTDLHFSVPKLFGADKDSKLMVQELVIGRSLDKESETYAKLAPNIKKAIIEEVAKLWINEVLYGGGFYHSDLHQGNFLVRMAEPKAEVTLLDFGMGGQIDKKTQQLLLQLGLALQMQKAELITDTYWNLSDTAKNQIPRAAFATKVEERLKNLRKKNISESLFDWSGWASNEGIRLPYDFINMNRGLMIISKSLEDAGSELTFTDIAKSLALRNPGKVMTALKSKIEEKIPNKGPAGVRCEQVFAL